MSSLSVSTAAKQNLREEFWKFTVAALASDLPPPRLEFNFDGHKLFTLQADESESNSSAENEFLLLDFEDAAEKNCKSKRGFRVRVADDESPATTGLVFAKVLPGTINSIDAAIEIVCAIFAEKSSWYETVHGAHATETAESSDDEEDASSLDAVILRAVVHHDECSYAVDRRYSNVLQDRGYAMHSSLRKSDWVIEMEKIGHAALTLLRALNYRIKSNTFINS